MGRLIVVIFGLMGTGKTTLARALGKTLAWPVVESDAVRKRLAGLEPTTRVAVPFGQGIYSPEFFARTYTEMLRLARDHLQQGAPGVILDGSYKREAERARARQLAGELGARAAFVCCQCAEETVLMRLNLRLDDAKAISDGRAELFKSQEQDFDPLTDSDRPLLRLDTGRELPAALAELQEFIVAQL